MSEIASLSPNYTANSAKITMTDGYTVINGSHYKIVNGYVHKRTEPASIPTKDILNVGRQTLRRKKALVFGLILFGTLLIAYGVLGQIGKSLSLRDTAIAAGKGDPQAQLRLMLSFISYGNQLGETVYGDDFFDSFVIDGDILTADDYAIMFDFMGITADAYDIYDDFVEWSSVAAGRFSNLSSFDFVRYTIYAVLAVGCVFFIIDYTFRPIQTLRIMAIGGDFAVRMKDYDRFSAEQFIKNYYDNC